MSATNPSKLAAEVHISARSVMRIVSLQSELADLRESYYSLEELCSTQARDLQKCQRENSELHAELVEARRRIEQLQSQCLSLQADRDRMAHEAHSARSATARLTQQLHRLEDDLARQKQIQQQQQQLLARQATLVSARPRSPSSSPIRAPFRPAGSADSVRRSVSPATLPGGAAPAASLLAARLAAEGDAAAGAAAAVAAQRAAYLLSSRVNRTDRGAAAADARPRRRSPLSVSQAPRSHSADAARLRRPITLLQVPPPAVSVARSQRAPTAPVRNPLLQLPQPAPPPPSPILPLAAAPAHSQGHVMFAPVLDEDDGDGGGRAVGGSEAVPMVVRHRRPVHIQLPGPAS